MGLRGKINKSVLVAALSYSPIRQRAANQLIEIENKIALSGYSYDEILDEARELAQTTTMTMSEAVSEVIFRKGKNEHN
ncbi:hypothetical protein LCGC14_0987040 [marine sediment metagenome]|uniref:ANTAR domain-containing protein n=1 Tax=marine sediment metagenome TaxID=412755 RepID=A0A0F9RDL2_9ZZZZ